jgi:nicotinate-nucleotide adenylyltransferase
MNIGVLGGSFDPPHLGHQALVSAVLQQKLFDEVWYLPAAVHDPQFSKPGMVQATDRRAMLELVVAEHQRRGEAVRLETIELDEHLVGFTHSTLRKLAARYPEHSFSFIIGSDQLEKLHLWGCDVEEHCFPGVFAELEWYVYPRGGSPIGELPFEQLKIIANVEPMTVSSTQVRERARAGETLAGLVEPVVEEYVLERGLYGELVESRNNHLE